MSKTFKQALGAREATAAETTAAGFKPGKGNAYVVGDHVVSKRQFLKAGRAAVGETTYKVKTIVTDSKGVAQRNAAGKIQTKIETRTVKVEGPVSNESLRKLRASHNAMSNRSTFDKFVKGYKENFAPGMNPRAIVNDKNFREEWQGYQKVRHMKGQRGAQLRFQYLKDFGFFVETDDGWVYVGDA